MMKLYVFACLLFWTGLCQAAAVVSNGTGGGKWSEAGTWSGRIVPADGDSVTIVAGDIVTFDADMSGWVIGIAGLTCNGTMTCSTLGGTYYLKTSGDIGGTGTINGGSSEIAYPSVCTMTFDFDSKPNSFECGAGLALNLHCAQPIHAVVALSDAAAAGQTELFVDADLSGDIWTPGKTVRIDAISGSLPNSEERVIRAAAGPARTIIVDAGLTTAKDSGSVVILVTRNIRIIRSTDSAVKFMTGGVLGCEISNCSKGVGTSFSSTISGVISNCSYGAMYAAGGVVSAAITGCSSGLMYPSGCLMSGTISGCSQGIYYGSGCMISGAISGCSVGVYAGSNNIRNAVLGGNKYDMRAVVCGAAYNTLFGSPIENYDYDTGSVPPWNYVASYDHDGVTGAFTAWTRGGMVVSDVDIAPPGYATSYRHMCTSSVMPCFRQEMITVGAGQTLDVSGKILILNNHDLWAPRLELIDVCADPLVDAGTAPLASALIPQPRGRYYWQDVTVDYTNTNGTDKQVWIRCSARQPGTDVYEVWDARLQ